MLTRSVCEGAPSFQTVFLYTPIFLDGEFQPESGSSDDEETIAKEENAAQDSVCFLYV